MGFGINCFVQVQLERQVESTLKFFEAAVRGRPEIMECYLMTGTSDYLLRLAVADLDTCHQLLTTFVARVPGVRTLQSSIALKQIKYETALPLPGEAKAAG